MTSIKAALLSCCICLLLFACVLAGGHPIYNSGDDVYLLYLLAGGYGDTPTQLLHYNYGLHPLLGTIIKDLFTWYPHINWYSVSLYLFHFISCCIFLQLLLVKRPVKKALLIFLLLFSVFEIPFLLQPTFTNSSLILAMAALLVFLAEINNPIARKPVLAVAVVLMVAATLLRVHTLLPVALVSLPTICLLIFGKRKMILFFPLLIAAVLIFLLNYCQQQYYTQKIPGWKTEEAYRQTALGYYNNPKKINKPGLKDTTAIVMLDKGLFWDKQFLSGDKINDAAKEVGLSAATNSNDFIETLHWLIIEGRIYWLALLIICLAVIPSMGKEKATPAILALCMVIGLLGYLLLYWKMASYLVPGLLLYWSLLATVLPAKTAALWPQNNVWRTGLSLLTLLALTWAGIHMSKLNKGNRQKNGEFLCSWKDVNDHPEKLFIVTDDHFPADMFSVWDTPQQFSMKNILYKDMMLNNTQQPLLDKYKIRGPEDFMNNPSVCFAGDTVAAIRNYYKERFNTAVQFTLPVNGFSCVQVTRLVNSESPDTLRLSK